MSPLDCSGVQRLEDFGERRQERMEFGGRDRRHAGQSLALLGAGLELGADGGQQIFGVVVDHLFRVTSVARRAFRGQFRDTASVRADRAATDRGEMLGQIWLVEYTDGYTGNPVPSGVL